MSKQFLSVFINMKQPSFIKRIKNHMYLSLKKYQVLSILVLSMNLTGCAGLVHSYGELADSRDPCQMKHKAENHIKPDWCHKGQGYTKPLRIYSPTNQHIATVR